MALSESDRRTLDYYDSHAAEWVATHGGTSGPSFWNEEMRNFEALLPSGRVLEIGPGAGKDAAEVSRSAINIQAQTSRQVSLKLHKGGIRERGSCWLTFIVSTFPGGSMVFGQRRVCCTFRRAEFPTPSKG